MLLCLLLWAGAAFAESAITSPEQLNAPGITIGVATDTAEDRLVAALLPQAKIEYIKDALFGYTAVRQGKLDAVVYSKRAMETAIRHGLKGVKLLDQTLGEVLGMAGEIEQYCNKNQIPYKMAHRIRLAFEELVQQMLMPALVQPDIQAVIEYSEAEESAVLTVRYNGPAFDVTAKGEELSLKVLQSAVSDMEYTWDEHAERGNQATMHIRTA